MHPVTYLAKSVPAPAYACLTYYRVLRHKGRTILQLVGSAAWYELSTRTTLKP
jgi:hypothetical protein